ncbi:Membrane complex biogenesis protein BtpA family, partial [Trinorchestia longiramus]
DALLVENMNDVPYVRPADVGPEVVSVMTVVCAAVRRVVGRTVPLGCQVLAGCNREAVAVAQASDLNFIRAEGYVFGHVADEGYTDACAGPLLRYRRQIGADGVEIWADIKKKHSSHALTDDVSVTDTAKAAAFFGASAVVLTGSATGAETDAAQLTDVHEAVPQTPVVVGSGVTHDNVQRYMGAAGLIVGSHFKTNGRY